MSEKQSNLAGRKTNASDKEGASFTVESKTATPFKELPSLKTHLRGTII
jgi:hypothetical protein